ncbi:histidine--tRNA ligase [Deinococcus peraridilitoris]|uniref:Histidine--tRNA ligase n=1 Tax=Deinococcus peraridilitoris (strain DSM 19664 / LMG 22246 / CIP 109416 / KR-200) TaxID=937777 RepID=L0A5K9_DEIPD|nr:histidine--tRNA ligase [Deinococcus peraridilitoris]AFZ69126.1 histidyl-tRNA synthetase [Deinococcus peraridilitoris DSM 19664]
MALLQRPKGTQDQLPEGSPKLEPMTSERWHRFVTSTAQNVIERSGAQFISTPMFEYVEVVRRGVGGSTDIVRKEMFTVSYFEERDKYVLRPEGTAPIARAFLENGLKQLPSPLRLWTHGPMFRAENVQKGRLRQFHQVDYEVIGSPDPLVDAEAIALMVEVFAQLGVRGTRVQLGSVGDPEDRARYNGYLQTLFTAHEARLSADSIDRLQRNPMRILDSKDKGDRALLNELRPLPMLDFLGPQAAAHFQAVQGYLTSWGVPFEVDPTIVRGLDYYNRTAWEIHHTGIGAQSALGGGGRYDGLIGQLGGQETPAVGWAFGVERALIALGHEGAQLPAAKGPLLYVVALDEELLGAAAGLALQARRFGRAEFGVRARKPGAALGEAVKKGAHFAALLGSEEAHNGTVSLKNLVTGEQQSVAQSDLGRLLEGVMQ